MREALLEAITLICPSCRGIENNSERQHPLKLKEVFNKEGPYVIEGFLGCSNPACAALYPVFSGVPVVLKDLVKWWESERALVKKPNVSSPEIASFFKILDDARISGVEQKALLGTYLDSHYGHPSDFSQFSFHVNSEVFFRRVVQKMIEPASSGKYPMSLDLGCSVGGYTLELARYSNLAIGLDNYFPAVSEAAKIQRNGIVEYDRKRRGKFFERVSRKVDAEQNVLFITADALDPPFEAAAFDLVTGFNLIENVKVPLILLGQIDALLKKSGILMFSSPYEWREDFCESGEWLENTSIDAPAMVRGILRGSIFPSTGFSYEIVEEHDSVPWPLKHHDRYFSIYLTHLFKARKLN